MWDLSLSAIVSSFEFEDSCTPFNSCPRLLGYVFLCWMHFLKQTVGLYSHSWTEPSFPKELREELYVCMHACVCIHVCACVCACICVCSHLVWHLLSALHSLSFNKFILNPLKYFIFKSIRMLRFYLGLRNYVFKRSLQIAWPLI